MKKNFFMTPQLWILIFTIIAAIAAFIATNDDNIQKNRIEDLGRIANDLGKTNKNLGEKVQSLVELNSKVSSQIDTIVRENKSLTQRNIDLTNNANSLISEVKKLSKTTNAFAEKLDIKTDE